MKRSNSSLNPNHDDSDDDSQNLDNNSAEELERSNKKVKRTSNTQPSNTQPSSPSAASASSSTDQMNDLVVVGAEPLEEYDHDNNSVDTRVSSESSYLTEYFNNDHAPGNVDYYLPLRDYDYQELFASLPLASNQDDDDEDLYSVLPVYSRRTETLFASEDLERVEDEDANQVMTDSLPEEHPPTIDESFIVDIIIQGISLWQERGNTGNLNDCIRDILQRLSLNDEDKILPILSKFLSGH